MSNALWCDHGQHAFSELDEGTQEVTITQKVRDAYGRLTDVKQTKQVCGKCAGQIALIELPVSDSDKEDTK